MNIPEPSNIKQTSLLCNRFVVSLKSGSMYPATFVLLGDYFGCSIFLVFLYELRITLSISTKKAAVVLIGIELNL